ncbi:MAG: ankyrin repeat protein [Fibrobacteres bacterium]|nr:ankyrin repeat protein [Fibrobacterota bacterium]
MNPIQKAAFLLDLAGLKSQPLSKETVGGALAQDRKSLSTALHRAVTHTGAPGTKDKGEEIKAILRALIQSGADIRIKNKMGKMPIEYVKDEEIKKIPT